MGNTIVVCALNPNTGALSNCSNSGATGLSTPNQEMSVVGNSLYVPNIGSGKISYCTQTSNLGLLSCVYAASGITQPNGE